MPEPTQPGDAPTPVVAPVAEPVVQPAAQPAPVVTPVQPVASTPGASDRTTEQFNKLIDSNQRLFEANELLRQEISRKEQSSQVFQPIQQQPVPVVQPSQPVNPNDFVEVDPVSGERYLNEGKLQSALQAQNEETARLRQTVQSYISTAEQREAERQQEKVQQQEQEAYKLHPEINPASPQFDAQLSDFTRAVIYDSLINTHRYGGKGLSFAEAAALVKSRVAAGQANKTMDQVVVDSGAQQPAVAVAPVADTGAAQEAKEQGSLAARGQTQPRPADSQDFTIDELRQITRTGGADSDRAIALRLTNIDHTRAASDDA